MKRLLLMLLVATPVFSGASRFSTASECGSIPALDARNNCLLVVQAGEVYVYNPPRLEAVSMHPNRETSHPDVSEIVSPLWVIAVALVVMAGMQIFLVTKD